MKKVIIVGFVLLLLLTACGGGNAATTEPVAQNSGANTAVANNEAAADTPSNPIAAEPVAAAEEPTAVVEEPTAVSEPDAASEEPAAEPEVVEPADEPAADDPYLGRPLSGIDPETGMEINPPTILKGTEFIVRGKITSMNLTPQTKPEFLIESPDGVRYRVQSQGLADIYLVDGSQLKPFEYKQGMFVQATVFQEANAGATNVVQSSDLIIFGLP